MSNTAVNTITNQKLEPYYLVPEPAEDNVKLPASVTYAKGTLLGELTAAPGTFKAYTSGANDGSQIIKRVLAYDVTTDASQNVSLAGLGPFGIVATRPSAPAYYRGAFRSEDIPQSGAGSIDANAVSSGGLKVISGTIAAGVVEIL